MRKKPSIKGDDLYKWNYLKHKHFGDLQIIFDRTTQERNICQIQDLFSVDTCYDVFKRRSLVFFHNRSCQYRFSYETPQRVRWKVTVNNKEIYWCLWGMFAQNIARSTSFFFLLCLPFMSLTSKVFGECEVFQISSSQL